MKHYSNYINNNNTTTLEKFINIYDKISVESTILIEIIHITVMYISRVMSVAPIRDNS